MDFRGHVPVVPVFFKAHNNTVIRISEIVSLCAYNCNEGKSHPWTVVLKNGKEIMLSQQLGEELYSLLE